MSAEPGRKAPYSSDLRWRVVWQRIGMELSFREIADNLCLSLGTVHNYFKRFQLTGEVAPAKVSSRESTRVLSEHDELTIVGLLLDDPSMYLSEMCQKIVMLTSIEVSPATICRIIHRNGFTRKTLHHVALQRSVECRGKFFAEVQFYDVHQFVWVDETGSDRKNRMRKFGYALRGVAPQKYRLLFVILFVHHLYVIISMDPNFSALHPMARFDIPISTLSKSGSLNLGLLTTS